MSASPIVFTCNSAFGVANFRGGVIRALVRGGHRVVVVAPPDPLQEKRLRALGAEFQPWVVSGRGTGPTAELASVRSLTAIYRDLRPALCFHFTIKAVIYGAIACRRLKRHGIAVITGLGYVFLNESWTSRVARMLYRQTLAWSQEVWFLNEEDLETFRRLGLLGDQRTRVLPGEGVDLSYFSTTIQPAQTPRSVRVFLMVARLLHDKGVLEFVEAARLVRRERPGTRFQLLGPAGADNPSAIPESQARAWHDDGVIEYLGAADDVRPAIAGADCVVLPSYREGVPRSLLEAAAMQRPLIATDVPGCRLPVIDGESGYLCKVRDAADLADKMLKVTDMEPERLVSMGARGRALMQERFAECIVVRHYIEALDRMLRRVPPEDEA